MTVAGIELGYTELTSNASQTAGTSGDVTGLSLTVTVGSRPILVKFGTSSVFNNNAAGLGVVSIQEGATTLATVTVSNVSVASLLVAGAFREVRLAPTPGSHTYKVNLNSITGTTTISGGTGSVSYLQVIQI